MFNLAGLAVRLGLWGRNGHVLDQAIADLAADEIVETPREVRVKELRAHLSSIVVPEHMLGKAPRTALKASAAGSAADDDNVVPFPVAARKPKAATLNPGTAQAAVADAGTFAQQARTARRQRKNYADAILASHSRPKRSAKARTKTTKAKAAGKPAKRTNSAVVWLAAR